MAIRPFYGLSCCAGYGGFDLGIKLAFPRARFVGYVEREAAACERLAERMEEGWLDQGPVWTDQRTFDGRPWRGVVDFVSGGYPCQPFSLAGKRLGTRDPRHLWPRIRRAISQVRPEWCFFENVPGHLSLGFETVATQLERLGYKVAAGLFTAEEVGASHRRERLFIVAHARRNDRAGRRDPGDVACSPGRTQENGEERQRLRNAAGDGGSVMADAVSSGLRTGGFRERRTLQGRDTTLGNSPQRIGDVPGIASADRLNREPRREQEPEVVGKSGRPGGSLGNSDRQREHEPDGSVGEVGRRTLDPGVDVVHAPRIGRGKGGPNQSFGAGGIPLPTQAASFPSSLPDLMPLTNGPDSLPVALKLNPLFVEMLMGWPIGWTGSEVSATEWFRWKQLMQSACLSLRSRDEQPSGKARQQELF